MFKTIVHIATDNNSVATSLSNTLLGQGYEPVAHCNLTEAQEYLVDNKPDLVLLNYEDMPSYAYDLVRYMQKIDGLEDVPVLVVTNDPILSQNIYNMHELCDFVRQPLAREDLLARVRNLVQYGNRCEELKLTKEQLAEAQKMGCVGVLAAGVAHEFNNLMCSVLGFADIARSDGYKDRESLIESADVSYTAAKRASTVAANLLAFSRQVETKKTEIDINDVVTDAMKLLRRNLDKDNVKVTLCLGDLPKGLASSGQLQQVFLNLIINAWHAVRCNDGEKLLKIVTSMDGSSKVRVTVEDNGCGIKEEYLDKIFEPFFTTKEQTESGRTGGSGLGLSIVREVIKGHNGLISVKSQVGVGSVFTVVLPIEGGAGDCNELENGSVAISSIKYSVLVVDDEEMNRKILGRILGKNGHDFFSVSNMAEAMSIILSNKIDLIVMDLIMPTMDGITAIKQLREEDIDIPVIICTGNVEPHLLQSGLNAGAMAIIKKPFSSAEFLDQMNNCMSVLRGKSTT